MCGISFVVSTKNNDITDIILTSITLIQNRGYDSYGIALQTINNSKYDILKYISNDNDDTIDLLKLDMKKYTDIIYRAFAHTRWSSHGEKNINNCHPHISLHKHIILVHNGIINNYEKIKSFLTKNKYKFYSDTDSEIIANLIEYNLIVGNNSIEVSIKKTIEELEGTFALIIAYKDMIYAVRRGMPLLLGKNKDIIMVTSETTGFAGYISKYIILNDDDIIKIDKKEFISVNKTNYKLNSITQTKFEITPSPFSHWLLKEILEQEHSILNAYNNGSRIVNNNVKLNGLSNLNKNINKNEIKNILLLGCGTSYHAALIGRQYFNNTNINVIAYDACEFTKYDIERFNMNEITLVLFCSQSGETYDLIKALHICKKFNCITIGIINQPDTTLTRLVDCGVYLNAGREVSVASTKSFTSMLIVLSLFKIWVSNNLKDDNILNNLRCLSSIVVQMLYDIHFLLKIDIISQYIVNKNFTSIFILGKGKLFAISKEISLKLKEICYIHAEGFSSSSIKHGPFAMLDSTNLTILLIDYTNLNDYNSIKSTYYEISGRNTNLFVITNNISVKEELNILDENILIILNLDYYNEILFTIALQYLSYNISTKKGINPDKPRNLAKVVTVE